MTARRGRRTARTRKEGGTMLELQLFWTFFKIGLFTIGGGHAMIPLIMEELVAKGWLSQEVLLDFIAISESTPGPFAVNIATYAGQEIAGLGGAIMCTVGVVLPSLIIIILIAKFFSKYMNRPVVQEVFDHVSGSVTGLLFSVVVTVGILVLFGMDSIYDTASFRVDYIALGLFLGLLALSFVKIKKKKIPPIALIIVSAVCGVLLYGFIPV